MPGLSSGSVVTNDMSHGMAQHNVAFFVTILWMELMDSLVR